LAAAFFEDFTGLTGVAIPDGVVSIGAEQRISKQSNNKLNFRPIGQYSLTNRPNYK
jgi:hypothetical protein